MTKKLKVAVVGTGAISTAKHIPAWKRQSESCEVVALCDLDRKQVEAAAQKFGIAKAYETLEDLLEKEKPDIVDIVTPPKSHMAIALQSLGAGAHVMLEKPMAMTTEECQQIIHASEKNNRKVCVAHSDLFYFSVQKARELLANGQIGELRGLRIFLSTPTRCFIADKDHWCHKLPGGVIGETGPHLVYLSMAFVKNINKIGVYAKKLIPQYPWSPFEDYRLILEGETVISSCMAIHSCDQYAAEIELIGSEAILRLDLETQSIIIHRRSKLTAKTLGISLLSDVTQRLFSGLNAGFGYVRNKIPSPHDLLAEQFARSISEGKPPPVSAAEGMESVRIMHKVSELLEKILQEG